MIRNDCGWNDGVDDDDVARASTHTIDSAQKVSQITDAGYNTPHRVALGKSTSVCDGEFFPRRCNYGPTKNHCKVDSRSVQSDYRFVSPTKPSLIGSIKVDEEHAQKRSASSIFDSVAERLPEVDSSNKKPGIYISISSHEPVSQHFPGFDNSQQILNMSGVFSESDTIDLSSFAEDDPASIFPSPYLSTGNMSDPSDLTSQTRTLDMPPSSRVPKSSSLTRDSERSVPASATDVASNFIAFPASLPNSTHGSFERRSKQGVPILIRCLPLDKSPTKPLRQTSERKLNILKGANAFSLMSIDVSPSKPKRQNSSAALLFDFDESKASASGLAIDSSPAKPERQKSIRDLVAPTKTSKLTRAECSMDGLRDNSSSGPEKRAISRSKKKVQPRLLSSSRKSSVTTRLDSVVEKPNETSRQT